MAYYQAMHRLPMDIVPIALLKLLLILKPIWSSNLARPRGIVTLACAEQMRLVVTGGGTGGHLFPGIALAEGIKQNDPDSQVLFIGTRRKLDNTTLQKYGFEQVFLSCLGLKGMGMRAKLRALFLLPGAVFEALAHLRRFKPDLVFGVGGYVTGPVLLAAKICGIPTCIHEQNSVPGLANVLAAKLVKKICISIPVEGHFPAKKTFLTGNPVRKEILAAASEPKKEIAAVPTLLILGGSQGAHTVNVLVTQAVSLLHKQGIAVKVIHQSGETDLRFVKKQYAQAGVTAECKAFFEDMATQYLQSDLVVSRAGATTLAELSVMGLPALLIPFPYAADNHQEINGRYYVAGGGAQMMLEKDCTDHVLAEKIKTLLHNPESLHTMGRAMLSMARPEATNTIVNQCLQLLQH